jgi:hypothetical protein
MVLYVGGKNQVFRDCMNIGYAEVVLSSGYKMKVRFGRARGSVRRLEL